MPKVIKPLTAIQVQNAKPKESSYKIFDGGGLFLHVTPAGGKHWKMKYQKNSGKESLLSFGAYPAITLEQARKMREEAKARKAVGIDPGEARRREKADRVIVAENTFEVVARDWLEVYATKVKSNTFDGVKSLLERLVFPLIGRIPVRELKAPDVLSMLRRLESQGTKTVPEKASVTCGQVMRFAVATGRADFDPTPSLRGSLKSYKGGHLAAITEPQKIGELLRTLHAYRCGVIVSSALKIAPYIFVRPGELRQAKWAEIDLEACEWRYIASKTSTPHIVPLAPQVMAILKELHLVTGQGEWVFHQPSHPHLPMGAASMIHALRAMGIKQDEMTVHGFRAIARTLLDEVLGERYDLIEQQLAHVVRDPNGRAYNRTVHLAERRRMMCRWADYLDSLRDATEDGKAEQVVSAAQAG